MFIVEKRCPSCGWVNLGDTQSCLGCQTVLPNQQGFMEMIHCPACHASIATNKKFCTQCGQQLSREEQPHLGFDDTDLSWQNPELPETLIVIEVEFTPHLVAEGGQLFGQKYPIKDGFTAGRAPDNDLVIEDIKVSRQHMAIFQAENEYWYVNDLDSGNGTYLNGKKLQEPAWLYHGNLLQISDHEFSVILQKEVQDEDEKNADEITYITNPTQVKAWYYLAQGEVLGPVNAGTLIQRLQTGEITPRTHVWHNGMADWERLENIQTA